MTQMDNDSHPPTGISPFNCLNFMIISYDGCGKRFTENDFVYRLAFIPVDTLQQSICVVCDVCHPKMGRDGTVTARALIYHLYCLLLVAEGGGVR